MNFGLSEAVNSGKGRGGATGGRGMLDHDYIEEEYDIEHNKKTKPA